MAIDRSGEWCTGSAPTDIDEYLTELTADGYAVAWTVHARCARCSGVEFKVRVDEEEGCAERSCTSCADRFALLDSQDYLDHAELEDAVCPCGQDRFNVAVGFARYSAGEEVHWVYLGLRCTADGVLGCIADWKIGYSPSTHLYDAV